MNEIAPIITECVRVLLVDKHSIWRAGVQVVLDGSEFVVVGEASSVQQALQIGREKDPQMVLLESEMCGRGRLNALQILKRELPGTEVVVLAASDAQTLKARALGGGAAGYLLKTIERNDLLFALRKVIRGERLLTADDLKPSIHSISQLAARLNRKRKGLTYRQLEVVQLLAAGLSNGEIAARLCVAKSTIKTHIENIMAKIHASRRMEIVAWAARADLLNPPK